MTDFQAKVRQALADDHLQEALDRNASRRRQAWESAFATLANPAAARREARRIREDTLDHLTDLLPVFRRSLQENGFLVHQAADSAEACALVLDIARSHGARRVVKSKSMVSEEIGLNTALQLAGLDVVETDLGEYIVQLRGEQPSHITAPAIHLRREEVGATFAERLGVPYTAEVEAITAVARSKLRSKFFEADIGISGVNFGVAETGTLCLVTNEGNGRMVATLPPVHIALMGMERLVPTLTDLARLLLVLPRAATGQVLTSYVSLLNGPRRPGDAEGPTERHLVLVDNGRRRMRESPLAEALLCIRCGACLNACPVYQEIGGHAYGSIYPGPIGSVVSPGLMGLRAYGHLARASTLCGACREACPIDIDLPRLLLAVRAEQVTMGDRTHPGWQAAIRVYRWAMASPRRYRWAQTVARISSALLPRRQGWVVKLPPPLSAWTRHRDFPPVARRPFRERWKSLANEGPSASQTRSVGPSVLPDSPARRDPKNRVERFAESVQARGADLLRVKRSEAVRQVLATLEATAGGQVAFSGSADPLIATLVEHLGGSGVAWVDGQDERGLREASLAIEKAGVGVTGVEVALADTGSLVLLSGEGNSLLPSLLPWVHLAVVPASSIRNSMEGWLAAGGDERARTASQVVLVTGPSRTADIEMTLTIGVHGPGRLIVLLVEDA
jgi:L-lactate dehydrogenase complex protein LldF